MAGTLAILFTVALETSCLNHVRKLRACGPEGRSLYASAWLCNFFNNVVLGGLTYYCTVTWICDHSARHSLREEILAACGVVVIEAVLYYAIHMAFHEVKGLYWMHKYHHKFNTVVLPSSANAVSLAEYVFAYMLPLVVGVKLTAADEVAAFSGALVVAVTNLLIHTPWLEDSQYPSWIFVTASDHLSHHRKTRGNYGAPVFNLDRIIERCSPSWQLERHLTDRKPKPL